MRRREHQQTGQPVDTERPRRALAPVDRCADRSGDGLLDRASVGIRPLAIELDQLEAPAGAVAGTQRLVQRLRRLPGRQDFMSNGSRKRNACSEPRRASKKASTA